MILALAGAIPLIGPVKNMGRWRKHVYEGVGKSLGIDLKMPWKKLTSKQRGLILHGSGDTHIVWEWKMRGEGTLAGLFERTFPLGWRPRAELNCRPRA